MHELYLRAEAAMGSDSAETLMSLLPPVGWADVATKQDIAMLDRRIGATQTGLERMIDASEHRIVQTMTWRLVQISSRSSASCSR